MHFPLSIPIGPSGAAMASILAAHAAVGLALFHVLGLSPWAFDGGWMPLRLLGFVLWSALAVSLFDAFRKERAKRGLVLVLRGDGGLTLKDEGEAAALDYRLRAAAVDFGWAVWLPLAGPLILDTRQAQGVGRRLMLLRGNMAAPHWRLLRVWLRHKAAPLLGEVSPDRSDA